MNCHHDKRCKAMRHMLYLRILQSHESCRNRGCCLQFKAACHVMCFWKLEAWFLHTQKNILSILSYPELALNHFGCTPRNLAQRMGLGALKFWQRATAYCTICTVRVLNPQHFHRKGAQKLMKARRKGLRKALMRHVSQVSTTETKTEFWDI